MGIFAKLVTLFASSTICAAFVPQMANTERNGQNWLNLAAEMNDNDTSYILQQYNQGNVFRFYLK